MERQIEKVAVLGAGVMGSTIAAHVAGVGIPCYLLDIVPTDLTDDEKAKGLTLDDPAVRNRFGTLGIRNALKSRPPAFYDDDDAALITVGNLDDNMDWLDGVDWIVEAVVENLDVKQRVFKSVEKFRSEASIVSSNTSGLPIKDMTEGLSKEMVRHFLGTHFFNPVRYMHLLELIPGPDTDKEVLDFMAHFGERVLGKGVVFAKDTPNFIANRIGTWSMMAAIKAMKKSGYKIEEVDKILGPATGRPKSAIFRTADIVGLDTLMHVADNVYRNLPDDPRREVFRPPEFMREMVEKGMLGEKTKQGFYKRTKVDGKRVILALDLDTMEYREQETVSIDSLGKAKGIDDPAERMKEVVVADDRAGKFAWRVLSDTLLYAAQCMPEIADDVLSVDNAMKWGFNWEIGPFEAWDAIGVRESVERMKKEGKKVPQSVTDIIEKGEGSFYVTEDEERKCFDFATGEYKPIAANPYVIILKSRKDRNEIVKRNAGASLIDIGDGVACLEFHTKMNSIDTDVIQMIFDSVEEVKRNFVGLVIGNDSANFSVGANLLLLLMQSRAEDWDAVEDVVRRLQNACMLLRYSDKPVVAAPFGMALGGGAEIPMGADRICAHAELHMGQVEAGVGLIPGAGGTKELLLRCMGDAPVDANTDLLPYVQSAFQPIATAKVSTSAKEARKIGFLRPSDRIVMNRAHLIGEAKRTVLAMAAEGYIKPQPRSNVRIVGERGYAAIKMWLRTMKWSHYISDHDELVGTKLAYVLCGGVLPGRTLVDEQHLLDLEREAFVSLCGEEKTQQRMEHMLKVGKPLRN
jgi:3-hydroxyacyl-CoA dehydrogenase